MKTKLVRAALLMATQFGLPAQAQSEWLTVIGDNSDPATNIVEIDPSVKPAAPGQKMTWMRVSRAESSKSRDGPAYRSYEAVVVFDCPKGTARYSRVVFYEQPLWAGRPHSTFTYSPADVQPVNFYNITPNTNARIMRAACQNRTVTTN